MLNVANQYLDWVRGGEVSSEAQIPRESGAIIQRGLEKIAVYRDGHGKLHSLSATCRHLGGVVHWNPTERTWDCPCHGSRYDPLGRVIQGPANQGLAKADEGG